MEGDDTGRIPESPAADFNPLPPHGGRPGQHTAAHPQRHFNPLPPHGGRRSGADCTRAGNSFQSTPSAWRETRILAILPPDIIISIHSLRMEGDAFSRMPRLIFWDFNPLPPHGGRRQTSLFVFKFHCISIHSLRMEGDFVIFSIFIIQHFISIHSLRMEGDFAVIIDGKSTLHFNPLPPHGGRLISMLTGGNTRTFQSTPSAWRETSAPKEITKNIDISIHSLRMEGDAIFIYNWYIVCISIHSLRMEGDPYLI